MRRKRQRDVSACDITAGQFDRGPTRARPRLQFGCACSVSNGTVAEVVKDHDNFSPVWKVPFEGSILTSTGSGSTDQVQNESSAQSGRSATEIDLALIDRRGQRPARPVRTTCVNMIPPERLHFQTPGLSHRCVVQLMVTDGNTCTRKPCPFGRWK